MTDIKDLIKKLGEKKPVGRPKGIPKGIGAGTGFKKGEGPGPGRPKGHPKAETSGRQKGAPNKSTLLEKELNALLIEEVINEERYTHIINKIWIEATVKNSLTAMKLWLDIYNNHLSHELKLKVKTFDDIEKSAQIIMDEVCEGRLLIPQGKELMYMLHFCKAFRESSLAPGIEKFLEEEKNKKKH